MMSPYKPYCAALQAELSRQVEYLVSDVLGPAAVGQFIHLLYTSELQLEIGGVETSGEESANHEGEVVHKLYNYVLWWLSHQLGAQNVAMFVHTFLHPRRFIIV